MTMRGRLSTRLFTLGVALLILVLLSIGFTMWITRQLDGGAAAVNEGGRLRMQAWRLVSAVQSGKDDAEVATLVAEVDTSITLLRDGDRQRPLLVPSDRQTSELLALLVADWHALRPHWRPGSFPDINTMSRDVERFVDEASRLVLSIEHNMAKLTALLNLFQFVMLALAIAAAILTLYIGYMFVIHPLYRLREGLQRLEGGDLSMRFPVDGAYEFRELASGFNHMAHTLQSMYHGLERNVAEKTRDLQAERSRLAALYEVSSFLIGTHTLEQLAHGFAVKMRVVSGADAAAIRWSDEASQRYLMLASDCLPEDLIKEERCISPGMCACGQPQSSTHTRVIPISSQPDRLMGNCARAGFGSIVSVPIRLHNRILGEIDLFYRSDVSLTEEDRGLYDALAGHLANAVENLRTGALVREAAVSEERTLLARELHDSIAQSLAFLKIQISLLRQALQRGDAPLTGRVIDELETGVSESTHDVRELLMHFRTRTNSGDIEQALRTTLSKFEHQSGLKAQLDIIGHGVALPSDVQLQVLHVVQEALSNVRKHAGATAVHVTVERDPKWRFLVRDNGRGFDPMHAADNETHVGLRIMQERAARIGAQVKVISVPSEGTEVQLELVD